MTGCDHSDRRVDRGVRGAVGGSAVRIEAEPTTTGQDDEHEPPHHAIVLRVRVAVIGHVEWVEFLRLARVPTAGEIVHTRSLLQVPAGGGGVAAVQLARWLGSCRFYTAVGDDELG